MASPNMNMRDPAIYRIRHAHHHRTGDDWCIYPMYDYAHPIEDAIENITHSVCTLEFQDHRPFYDWVLERLAEGGFFKKPLPQQYEFARLNVTYVVHQQAQAAPAGRRRHRRRLGRPAHAHHRRPAPARLHAGSDPPDVRTGRHQQGGRLDRLCEPLEGCLREDLDPKAPRAMAVLDPVRLVLTNWAATFGSAAHREPCRAPAHPQRPELGTREFSLGPELWIERDDFAEVPAKGFFRLFPGNRVRLKYGYVVECTGCEKDASGAVTRVLATIVADTKSGTPGADAVKVKGTLTWLAVDDALPAEVRLYDRLFSDAHPDAGGKDFKASLNPGSKQVVAGYVEPSLAEVARDERFQFERHGYFVADLVDHGDGKPVFNRTATLRDTWSR